MIWKLMNKLFGYDYVYWRNTAAQGVSRVRTDFYDKPYYIWACGVRVRIENKKEVMWLTCKADKYLEVTDD